MIFSQSYKREIEHKNAIAMKNYRDGKPLFTRAVLKQFRDLLEGRETELTLPKYLDGEYKVTVSKKKEGGSNRQVDVIHYNCIEALTKPHPFHGDVRFMCPLTMASTLRRECNGYTMDEFKSQYAEQYKIWEESKTRQSLVEQLERFTPGQINGVKKIFGFALGNVAELRASYEGDVQRPFAQHATLKTIAKFLEEHNGGREVPCYSQDPALRDGHGAEFIKSIGITPLDDPTGFIEADESTFVVSIAPNIPVRQVIADITKPRAMLWDSVGEINTADWTWSEDQDGNIRWECPYTTDSTSPRVAALVEDYDHLDFVDHDKWFCATAMYARKD